MTPKIDYKLLGVVQALYEPLGYAYVELPWAVNQHSIRATLPEQFDYMTLGRTQGAMVIKGLAHADYYRDGGNCLVGSAEQSFIQMRLPPGRYMGITPCFRIEQKKDMLTQDMFMKLELHDNRSNAAVSEVILDAEKVLQSLSLSRIDVVETEEGYDLEMGGIEIGSYGRRSFEGYSWVYGTGIALPRFSVAKAFASVT